MLLTILKILGIILLVLLGIVLVLLLLVLFIPVRYRLEIHRNIKEGVLEGDPPAVPLPFASAKIKVTWLLHMLSIMFSYPEAAYVNVRLFGFSVFRSNKEKHDNENMNTKEKEKKKTPKEGKEKKQKAETSQAKNEKDEEAGLEAKNEDFTQGRTPEREPSKEENVSDIGQEDATEETTGGIVSRIREFLNKFLSLLKNIKYTITQICDKIKHIVNNIQYYIDVIKSETFHQAWKICSGEMFSLLKSIRPRKITGSLHIGTGDPASTGQVLAVYGILYPFIGSHIDVIPDFEQKIVEGELFIKGKITVFRFIKTAWVIYFNKDLRRLIKLFKREAA